MGPYSTVDITRDEVIRRIQDALGSATNEELGDALFALTCDHVLDNYCVVDVSPPDRYSDPRFSGDES